MSPAKAQRPVKAQRPAKATRPAGAPMRMRPGDYERARLALMQAVRLAVSGSSASPGLFEMMALVGRDVVIARLRRAAAHLS